MYRGIEYFFWRVYTHNIRLFEYARDLWKVNDRFDTTSTFNPFFSHIMSISRIRVSATSHAFAFTLFLYRFFHRDELHDDS